MGTNPNVTTLLERLNNDPNGPVGKTSGGVLADRLPQGTLKDPTAGSTAALPPFLPSARRETPNDPDASWGGVAGG